MKEDIMLSRLLDSFLLAHPTPTRADWRALVNSNPSQREDIADFAAVFCGLEHVTEEDVRSNFGIAPPVSKSLSFALQKERSISADPLGTLGTQGGRDEVIRVFGLKDHLELIFGVFIGQVEPPARLVEFLAEVARIGAEKVREAFEARHTEMAVSMSSKNKPQAGRMLTWADEVNRLVADPAERRRLLALDTLNKE